MRSCEELISLMRVQFRSSVEGIVEDRSLVLWQEGSVMAYRLAFETLAASIGDISDAILEGHFINGLRPEITAKIRVMQPK